MPGLGLPPLVLRASQHLSLGQLGLEEGGVCFRVLPWCTDCGASPWVGPLTSADAEGRPHGELGPFRLPRP